ncbi:lipid phosphate phosphatase 2 [Ophiostoma piceae UAMH 11346]|uniref:Lipid phosphate phosphatase 2 n=1 Tax=Ophiostoma piceae (strain UAMH 11346) TaxID=1262450 RepID=S3BR20_OPHP1|nr:lipid phosphate phosphatase 2 [Ophiostoma piceae UAMH 11346]
MACRSLLRAMRGGTQSLRDVPADIPARPASPVLSLFSVPAGFPSAPLRQPSPPPPPADGKPDGPDGPDYKPGFFRICHHRGQPGQHCHHHCKRCRHICHRLECYIGMALATRVCAFVYMSFVWLWHSWVDIATILSSTAMALVLYMTKPPTSRSFAVTDDNGSVVYPEFALPLRTEIVPSWLAILLGPVVPVVCILALQLRVRSFWDANNAIFGVLYSLTNSVVFQVILKWLIGGLRPHFLDVCKPDLSLAKTGKSRYNAAGFKQMYYTRDVCTGDHWQVNDSLTSFPSGHTTAAFAGFVFLSLYMNGKFKIFSNRHTPLWKLTMFNTPILCATLIGGALTIDAFHNWYDIVAGAIIGTFMAFTSYRMTYAAVFDYRYNHIPMNRVKPFNFDSIDPHQSEERHFGLTHLDNSRLYSWSGSHPKDVAKDAE